MALLRSHGAAVRIPAGLFQFRRRCSTIASCRPCPSRPTNVNSALATTGARLFAFEKSNVAVRSRLRCATYTPRATIHSSSSSLRHTTASASTMDADEMRAMKELLLKQGPYTTGKGVLNVEKHIIPAFPFREYPRGVRDEDDKLHIVVNHYRPVSNPEPKAGDLTLIMAHANGFHKEMYEPFLEYLTLEYEELGGKIRGIFIAEMYCQGESGILNESKLGGDVSWFDHTRDLLSLIQHFPNDIVRPVAGIGHSMGGAQLFRLSLMHPSLMSCVIGIDPVISPTNAFPSAANPAAMSARRLDVWPSREQAVKFFRSRPYYQTWDEDVFLQHMDMGLRQVPTALYPDVSAVEGGANAVTLTTTKHQEVFTFWRYADRDRIDPKDMFRWLGDMTIPVCYIQGKKSVVNWANNNELKMEATPQPCEMHFVDAGHLVPLERPSESAGVAAEYLLRQVKAWKEKDEAYKQTFPPMIRIPQDFAPKVLPVLPAKL